MGFDLGGYVKINIKEFFDEKTSTFTYVVSDSGTNSAAIIDPVLTYDQASGRLSNECADLVIQYIIDHGLYIQWILETHIHADHFTGSGYIKQRLGGRSAIGSGILEVLKFWLPKFNISHDTPADGSQFDIL